MNYNNLCINCMKEKPSQEGHCPYCGFDAANYQPAEDVLQPYTVLNGKYILGRVLGRGGFGITYLGYDCVLERTVAIKEFFPAGVISRRAGKNTISMCRDQEMFLEGRSRFIKEGQTLSRFMHVSSIVDIYNCFLENGTGYIVMEYLQGETLQQKLKREGRMSFEEAEKIILEILYGLRIVHRENLIHRDISPDNIFLETDGTVKLLDFGASRYVVAGRSVELTAVLKPGYAPIEQYSVQGEQQGPWTDIYAVGATFYRMITGKKPPEATARIQGTQIPRPSSYGISITGMQENILMRSLEFREQDRIQTADEFISLLEDLNTTSQKIPLSDLGSNGGETPLPPPTPKSPLWIKVVLAIAAAVVVFAGVMIGYTVFNQRKSDDQAETQTSGTELDDIIVIETESRASSEIRVPVTEPISEQPVSEKPTTEEEPSESSETNSPETESVQPLSEEPVEETTVTEPVTEKTVVDYTQYPIPNRKIKYKEGSLMTGDDVKYLQAILLNLGYDGFELNGEYDSATNEAMKQFEANHGLEADGIVGSATLTALQEAVGDGTGSTADHTLYPAPSRTLEYDTGSVMVGNDVKYVQSILVENNYADVEVNGRYDEATSNAVMEFEIDHGLEGSGIVSDKTLEALQATVAPEVTDETRPDHTLYPVPERKLRYRKNRIMTGEDVKYVQAGLIELGFTDTGMTVNGTFDQATKQAVQEFETQTGQDVDGIVGEETLSALQDALDG